MRKRSSAQIRRRVVLFPNDVVQQAKSILLKSHTNTRMGVHCTGDPNRAGLFKNTETLGGPGKVELIITFKPPTSVPLTFVHWNHFSTDTGNTIIRQVVWRVCPNTINRFIWNGCKQMERVAQVKRRLQFR